MARIARVVAPGLPHHITQRGNRRQETFFCEEDYEEYIGLMSGWCRRWNVDVWAYCLMPNHVHMIMVPASEEGLRRAIGEAHQRYTRRVNFREGWRGHLWQGRFASAPLDERYLLAAARYVELNPVRAGLVKDPAAYPWSSAAAHTSGTDDALVKVKPLLEMVGNWRDLLLSGVSEQEIEQIRRHERTGRPLGSDGFVGKLEGALGRILHPQKPGRKRGHKQK
jgi:putative transposase